jgi:hypothetical protein
MAWNKFFLRLGASKLNIRKLSKNIKKGRG